MKPVFEGGKLTVELHKPERTLLARAREIGEALTALHQETGAPLVDAIDKILGDGEAPAE